MRLSPCEGPIVSKKKSVLCVHVPVYRLAVRWLILGGLTSDKYARPFQTRDSKMSSLSQQPCSRSTKLFSIEISFSFRARAMPNPQGRNDPAHKAKAGAWPAPPPQVGGQAKAAAQAAAPLPMAGGQGFATVPPPMVGGQGLAAGTGETPGAYAVPSVPPPLGCIM